MRRLTVMLWAFGLSAAPAAAHPHVWIELRSDVVIGQDSKITAINLEWRFDQAYNEVALEGLDTDGDGTYSQKEIEPLTKENMESLKEWDYFTAIKVDGKKAEFGAITEYGQVWSEKGLALHFTVPLKTPVDPRSQSLVYRVYDPTFFIAIDYPKDDPVTVIGAMPAGCALEIKPVVSDAELAKTQTMLAEKGKDWTPAPEEDFGAMFAQPVSVVCK